MSKADRGAIKKYGSTIDGIDVTDESIKNGTFTDEQLKNAKNKRFADTKYGKRVNDAMSGDKKTNLFTNVKNIAGSVDAI